MPETLNNTFKPLGPAPIQDPFRMELNIANPWGSGIATGAINTLCMVQDQTARDGILYAGATAGGVWGRAYVGATDSWGEWKWLSSASGYEGAQSISKIKVSTGNKWLVAAQGATSSASNLQGHIDKPLQVAERLADGSIKWIANGEKIQDEINGQAITALETADDLVIVGSQKGLYISSIDSAGKLTTVVAAANLNGTSSNYITSIAKGESGRLYAAILGKGIYTTTVAELKINPAKEWTFINSSEKLSAGAEMMLVATSRDPATGKDILYLGYGVNNQYSAISRVIYNSEEALKWETLNTANQIATHISNGYHMTLAAHPTEPYRVFAGGAYQLDGAAGGLTEVIFDGRGGKFDPHARTNSFPMNADGTAPHGDSRDIIFLTTKTNSTRIIQANDGGIAIKDINIMAPWKFNLNEGLRTTEGNYSDWSNIGKLAITAMQDNGAAVGQYSNKPTWLSVVGADGTIARFDDGEIGSDGISRAYFAYQKYSGGVTNQNSYDANGTLLASNVLNLSIIDKYKNAQDWADYEINWLEKATLDSNGNSQPYPFYSPAETSDIRAGDVVFAGMRNIYEQVRPHWESVTQGEMVLVPLLSDTDKPRFFTDITIGSDSAKSFSKQKPFSWDTLYTSFSERSVTGWIPKLYGRQASTGINDDWFENKGNYMLKDLSADLPTETKKKAITGIAYNPTKPYEIWATVSDYSVPFTGGTKPAKGSYLIYSPDAGKSWKTIAESGKNGIPEYATLQQVIYAPVSSGGTNAEIYIGGYGGVWNASVGANSELSSFKSVRWEGVEPEGNFNMWNTNLEYDPVDDVIIASIMAQGAWLLNRSKKDMAPAQSMEPGLRITNVMLPQNISSLRNRKKRDLSGSIEISLQRSNENKDKEVTVDLILPDDYAKFINIRVTRAPLDKSYSINKNRIQLFFPKGVNELSLELGTAMSEINIPDKKIEIKLENAKNSSIADPTADIFLYATDDLITLNEEAPGVFYSNKSVWNDRYIKGQSQVQQLEILMPRASLKAGDRLFWFDVNSDGTITNGTNKINPSEAGYIPLAKQGFNLLATSSMVNDPRAFSPDKALIAFSNPSAVLASEGIEIGDLSSAAGTRLPFADRFAFALEDSKGNISVSTKDFKIAPNPILDNTVVFGVSGAGSQVVLAPAEGELFVVDEFEYYAQSNAGASTVDFNLDVASFGNYKSGYGLFRVDNQFGDFLFVDNKYLVENLADGNQKIMPLQPGSTAYAKEAFKRSQSNGLDGITGLPIQDFASSKRSTVSLAKGNSYGLYITPDKVFNSVDQLNDLSEILFSVKKANLTQQLQQVSMGTGYFAFEDMGFAGDRDFNDMLFAITPKNPSII